jgi:hypothetical protein
VTLSKASHHQARGFARKALKLRNSSSDESAMIRNTRAPRPVGSGVAVDGVDNNRDMVDLQWSEERKSLPIYSPFQ